MSSPQPAADHGGAVATDSASTATGPLRSPGQALLHALPAIALIVSYLWMAIAVPVVLLEMRMPTLPLVGWIVLVVLGVPGLWVSWRIIRQCIAAEQAVA